MFLVGCRSPSCLAAEKRDVLCQFSVGRYAILNIIDRPFHYRSLAYLILAMLVYIICMHVHASVLTLQVVLSSELQEFGNLGLFRARHTGD